MSQQTRRPPDRLWTDLLTAFSGLRTAAAVLPARQVAVGAAKVGVAHGVLAAPSGRAYLVVGCLTVAVYGLNDLTDREEDAVNAPGGPPVDGHRSLVAASAVTAAVVAMTVAATGGPLAVALALVPAVLGVAYSAPVLPGPGPDRLKDVLGVNTATTSLAWAVPVAGLPVAFAGPAPGASVAFVGWHLFARTYVASEYANVPDTDGDAAAGVRTAPVVHGPGTTRRLLVAADGVAAAAVLLATWSGVVPLAVGLALLPGVAYSTVVLLDPRGCVPARCVSSVKDLEFPLSAALVLSVVT